MQQTLNRNPDEEPKLPKKAPNTGPPITGSSGDLPTEEAQWNSQGSGQTQGGMPTPTEAQPRQTEPERFFTPKR